MPLTLDTIHSYLVHPDKHKDEATPIRGTAVPQVGLLFDMLKEVFDKSDKECTYDITFDCTDDGTQQNDCRDEITKYLRQTTLANGTTIAERLQSVTTGKSKLGLLFLLSGKNGQDKKIVLSRFPADSGILAEESSDGLSVEFLEKVFMKSATAYKAVVYRGKSLSGDFWDGKAVDKQINSGVLTISNYWIKDFLISDFKATSAQGTKRLANALLAATKQSDDAGVKQEIVAAARLSSGLAGKTTSIKGFCSKFQLSAAAQSAVADQLPNDAVFTEQFRFSSKEFEKHIVIQSVELSNGAILMAPANDFDNVFKQEQIKRSNEVRYSTQAEVIDQRLRKGR